MYNEDTQTLTKMQEFSITTCSDRAKEKFKRLEERIDEIAIDEKAKILALYTFSFLINPTMTDNFTDRQSRIDFWNKNLHKPDYRDHETNRLRFNNVARVLHLLANQKVYFKSRSRSIEDAALNMLDGFIYYYETSELSRKKAVLTQVDGLIHEFINFHCEEAVAV